MAAPILQPGRVQPVPSGTGCCFFAGDFNASSTQRGFRVPPARPRSVPWSGSGCPLAGHTPMWTVSTPEDTSRSSFSVMPGSSCGVLPQLLQRRKARKSTSFPAVADTKCGGMPHTSASTMSIRCKREKGNKREQIKSSARRYFFFPQQFLYFLPLPQGQGAFLAGVPATVAAGAAFALNFAAISPR